MQRFSFLTKIGFTITLIVVIHVGDIQGQLANTSFKFLTTKEGLSNNYVISVFEDSRCFLWYATTDGLNCWNGYEMKIFRTQSNNTESLPGNFILCMAEDSLKNLWIGTNQNGIARYNLLEEKFYRYNYNSSDETTISNSGIRTIFVDNKNHVWIGTYLGLSKYEPTKDNFKHIPFYSNDFGRFFNVNVSRIFQYNKLVTLQCDSGLFQLDYDKKGEAIFKRLYLNAAIDKLVRNQPICFSENNNIWVGAENKLIKVNLKTNERKEYVHNERDSKSISSKNISIIFEDSRKNIWVGTSNNGVNLYNSKTDDFTVFKSENIKESGISNNIITSIFEDSYKNIWFATQEGGLSYYNFNDNIFKHYQYSPFNNSSLSNNKVSGIFEDNNKTIWIGTGEGTLNKFLPDEDKFVRFHLKNEFISPCVHSIKQKSRDELYLTGWDIGLYEFNTLNGRFTNILKSTTSNNIPSTDVKGMGIDTAGRVWVANHNANGVFVFDNKKNIFYSKLTPGKLDKDILSVSNAVTIFQDSKFRLWIVSCNGLFMYDSIYHAFLHDLKNPNSISSDYVYTIFEDSKKNIWVGSTNGLDEIIEKNRNYLFIRYSEKYRIPNNIKGILEDDKGNLWISSNQGITKFNPETKKIKHFQTNKELPSQEFFENSCLKSSSGEMYFGSTSGFFRFNPESIEKLKTSSKLYIIDFQIFNHSQKPLTENSPLHKSITETNNIELSYNQSVISFEYVALNLTNYGSKEYAYTMEGFDKNWYFVGEKRIATYTNLPPGEYTFRVKTVDGGQLSNDVEANIHLLIHPPLWRTKWAYIVYFLFIISLLYLFRRTILNREKLKHELKMEKLAIQNVRESNLMKLRFFTNISHEFRTPLTLIIAPLEKLIHNDENLKSEERISNYWLIQNSAKKLLKMVNQLMDYRKLEAGSLILEASLGDIVEFCKNAFNAFKDLAVQKNIKYTFQSNIESEYLVFDTDKMDKILSNLLSNAFKYTIYGDSIEFKVEKSLDEMNIECVKITVKDSGIGIPEKDLSHVFERFYRVPKQGEGKIEGTGIGLTLAKELTELHNGTIKVRSVEGEGSEFIIYLPIIKREQNEENRNQKENETEAETLNIKLENINSEIEKRFDNTISQKRKKVLIIEDDDNLRAYLKSELLEDYNIITAKDGEEGLRRTYIEVPDLIVSDVMMPHMDGIEFCKSVKSDEKTSHIPVILLTARHSQEKQIEGLQSGADDYILKPFNRLVLLSRISNLLKSRQEIISKFNNSTNLLFDISDNHFDNKDKKLIQSAIDLIVENINEEKLNADFISGKLLISRALLYLKIDALTGQSVNEFIRNIRLKKATKLLIQSSLNISEVAFEVGFSSQSYFTKSFSALYGLSPKEYREQNCR